MDVNPLSEVSPTFYENQQLFSSPDRWAYHPTHGWPISVSQILSYVFLWFRNIYFSDSVSCISLNQVFSSLDRWAYQPTHMPPIWLFTFQSSLEMLQEAMRFVQREIIMISKLDKFNTETNSHGNWCFKVWEIVTNTRSSQTSLTNGKSSENDHIHAMPCITWPS